MPRMPEPSLAPPNQALAQTNAWLARRDRRRRAARGWQCVLWWLGWRR